MAISALSSHQDGGRSMGNQLVIFHVDRLYVLSFAHTRPRRYRGRSDSGGEINLTAGRRILESAAA
jgi:hypothetical protein